MRMILGSLSSLYFFLNTVFWCLLFYPLELMKVLTPKKLKFVWSAAGVRIAEAWIATNNFFLQKILGVKVNLELPPSLEKAKSYFVISNHRSWVDILALQMALNKKIPFLRFFVKDSLKWVPLLGLVWKALDYPFMKRYTRDELKLKPWLKGQDLETAKQACLKLLGKPSSVLIFLEGTRFSQEKRSKIQSPFKNLLPPKAGGAIAVMDILGKQMASVLDVTIIYPQTGAKTIWNLFSGKLNQVIIQVREIEIPEAFRNARISEDLKLRSEFESWLTNVWKEKDLLVSGLLQKGVH